MGWQLKKRVSNIIVVTKTTDLSINTRVLIKTLSGLDKLKSKIESDQFDTYGTETPYDGAYYSENKFPLYEPKK